MKNLILLVVILLSPSILYAHKHGLADTTFAMSCFVISPDDKWSYRDYGFTLTYHDSHHKKQTISAESKGTKKNCTDKIITAKAKIPAGTVKIHIKDFTGEQGSTIECTNTIKYKLKPDQIGKVCEFMVKTPKYGSYTSTDECDVQMDCNAAAR